MVPTTSTDPGTHPTPEQVVAYSLGKLDDAETATVHQHLETCDSCRQAAGSVPPDSFVGLVRSVQGPVSVSSSTPLLHVTQGLTALKTDAQGSPADVLPELPPELAGHAKFRILRELGRGGMGVVYQAEHRLMKRPVAIKVLSRRLLDNPAALARFHQESEAAAHLAHPNIVTAHDAEQAGDLHLLVMEYVEGQSLAHVLERQGPLPIVYACRLAEQAARGLQHAFEKKMIHRDIKPHNLMLTPQGVVKILDFGLARIAERPRLGGLTDESVTMGTPEYIAPEQATDARQADIRSDIYSLGCTLYCLLTGRPPFQGGTSLQIILAHLNQEAPPLRQLRPEVPKGLAAVVAKMMARKPEERYQTPAEVMAALAPFSELGRETGTTQTAPWADRNARAGETMEGKRRPAIQGRRWVPATLAVLAALAVGGWLLAGLILKVQTPLGTIVLEIDQPGAEVFVDDKQITVRVPGSREPVQIEAPQGRHELKVTKGGFQAFTTEIELLAGKATRIKVTLVPDKPEPTPAADARLRRAHKNRRGDWKIDGAELVQESLGVSDLFFGDVTWTDYDFTCEAKQIGGKAEIQLKYRVNNEGGETFGLGGWGNNLDFATSVEVGAPWRQRKHRSEGVQRDRWYRLEVRLRGAHCQCFRDEQLLFGYDGLKNLRGAVGLGTYLTAVRFRNLRVTDPAGKVLFAGLPELAAPAGE